MLHFTLAASSAASVASAAAAADRYYHFCRYSTAVALLLQMA